MQTMRYITIAFGGLMGSAIGGWYTERFHPSYAFLVLSVPLTIIFLFSISVEEEQEPSFTCQINLRERLLLSFEFLSTPLARRIALFILVSGVFSISFGDIMYFFLLDQVGLTK